MELRRLEPLAAGIFAVLVGIAFVQVSYRTQPVVPLIGAGALGAGFLALWRPMWVLYLAIAAIPLELFSLRFGSFGLSPSEALFLLTGFAWAVKRLAAGEAPWSPNPLGKPYALLLLAAVPGIAISTAG